MVGAYQAPAVGVDVLIQAIGDIQDRLKELERPTGTQTANAVKTLTGLVNALPAQIFAILATSINTGTITATGDVVSTGGTFWSSYALNNPVTSGYFALYVNADGRFGRTPSARKYKQDIANFSTSEQAVFAMQLRQFRLIAAVEEFGDSAAIEHGLIAEELVEIGLDWLVLFGPDGEPEGIAYEKVALALIPVIQDHERRLRALEG